MNKNHGSPLENWIRSNTTTRVTRHSQRCARNVRDVMRLHHTELAAIKDLEARYRRVVELNVLEQCVNVFKTHAVQRRRVETFRMRKHGLKNIQFTYPRVHGMVFHPGEGVLRRLPVKEFLESQSDNLGLYTVYTPGQTTMDMP